MQRKTLSAVITTTLLVVAVFSIAAPVWAASHYQLLYSFAGGNDGAISWAGMVFDAAGNLYGTTITGGAYGYGTVFKLAPETNGARRETVLHSFNPNSTDGNQPEAGVIFDRAGNLYGTTAFGGAHGEGTVFKLTSGANGIWSEAVLFSFTGGNDGGRPSGSLIFDSGGNLYGTTSGAPPARGNVFKLAPGTNGVWTETVLHTFNGNDGWHPAGGLIFDAAGNLYGTTSVGGANLYFGNVFKLTPGANGKWTETVLHSFSSKNGDGAYPYDSLIFDGVGNLYGTSYAGGNSSCFAGCGIVFKLTPSARGKWTEAVLYSFTGGVDGGEPYAGLAFDTTGNLYGTTNFGGNPACPSGCGTVFKLTLGTNGKWTETVLHRFQSIDGEVPYGNLVFDAAGNLYGTTLNGGDLSCGTAGGAGCGVVFRLMP